MVDQASFIEAVRSVQKIMQAGTEPLSKEEIQSYFQEMELSSEQQELICQYLQNPQQAFAEEKGKRTDSNAGSPQQRSGGEAGKGRHTAYKSSKLQGAFCEEARKGKPAESGRPGLYPGGAKATLALSRAQDLELYRRLLAGEASVIAEINHQWQGRLAEIAGEYTAEKAWREELVQEGNVGLLVGLDRLLGKEGEEAALVEVKLESYVRESMEEFCQKEESTEYQEKLLLAKVNFIHEAQKQLAEENFALPTVQELADFTRMPEEEVMAILSLSRERD
ncbi:MAG: hypothetical protein HFH39_06060 [Lachnospiraceae bacterium]|nr:hypothetical protein [Lachnospiraceae bacterium]